MFLTANVEDFEVYNKVFEAAAIYLGEKPSKINTDFLKFDNFNFKIEVEKSKKSTIQSIDSQIYVGYYHQPELETVQQVEFKNNLLFINLKNVGIVPLTLTGNNHEFKISTFGKGRFIVQDGKVVGMLFIELIRANNILWRKLSTKPICSN